MSLVNLCYLIVVALRLAQSPRMGACPRDDINGEEDSDKEDNKGQEDYNVGEDNNGVADYVYERIKTTMAWRGAGTGDATKYGRG